MVYKVLEPLCGLLWPNERAQVYTMLRLLLVYQNHIRIFLYHLLTNREALASTATGVRESLWLGRAIYCTIDGAELGMLYYMDFSTL